MGTKLIGDLVAKRPSTMLWEPDAHMVLPQCQIGVEFEFENVLDPKLPGVHPFGYYNAVDDGSLKQNGKEYAFKQPLAGGELVVAIEELCREARERRWNPSKRAGLHVHVDVRDLTPNQLLGMLTLYAIAEPALYTWAGNNRHQSVYSVPWYESDMSVEQAARIVSAAKEDSPEASQAVRNLSNQYHRYSGLNLNSLQKFGSLEFRHMRSTHDSEKILTWINMIQHLKRASLALPESSAAILDQVRGAGSMAFLTATFHTLARVLGYSTWDEEFYNKGLTSATNFIAAAIRVGSWSRWELKRGEHPGYKKFIESNR